MNRMKEKTGKRQLFKNLWVGDSTFIQLTHQRLASMAKSQIPVLIVGQTGTGKRVAAHALHEGSDKSSAPFVCFRSQWLNDDSFAQKLEEEIKAAQGGSVYIADIDTLTSDNAKALKAIWPRFDGLNANVRLIASTTRLPFLEDGLGEGECDNQNNLLLRWLHYHCLNIRLPTLAERESDIEALVQWYQQSDPQIAQLSFQDCAWEVLRRYAWPANVKQLKRCLDKLAMQAESTIINREVLLNCFPTMVSTKSKSESTADITNINARRQKPYLKISNQISSTNGSSLLAERSMMFNQETNENRLGGSPKSHPSLNKAISYLYNNFKLPLTMEELAGQACISPSHLSYLFKIYLGMSFKQVLLRLRIVKAMEILSENPNRHVTQVCDDVGFSDLSFFVRKFKATVGISPGVYRDQFSHTETSRELLALVDDLAHPLLLSQTSNVK
ncbi:helix-turn-helix domain-containing protein [Vibrio ostreicida]|uniref:helix-turn-helix domain-containing protein n=1 Tax=Vibrio ostreicida TaxID=526588 RepID=UPI00097023AB|nr:helix-turn-helix domain-containing protein [Vibrio ostreicida]